MEPPEAEQQKAGFWARFTAIWIDSAFVLGLTYLIVVICRAFGVYVPLELCALGIAVLYSVLLIGLLGQTIGKGVCGLTVATKTGTPVDLRRAFLREFIAKPVVALVLPLALIFVMVLFLGPPREGLLYYVIPSIVLLVLYIVHFVLVKRTWYDYFTRTIVLQDPGLKKQRTWAVVLVLGISTFFIARQTIQYADYYGLYRDMLPYATAKTPYDDRSPDSLVDVSAISPSDDSTFTRWIAATGKTPVDYAVQAASSHQVVVFGEMHGIRSQVSFLNEMIPALYHRAGVRCIAMEVCTHEDNEAIARLVTAPEYDHGLALRIARNQPWHTWGGKEYWDVLETVWRLNKGLAKGEKPMRVVGIDSQWDGPSFALAFGGGDDAVQGPIWEKLRVVRALLGSLDLFLRDELIAREVERQILSTGERGIVWCGGNHSFINYKQPYGRGRMAYMLHQKYGDKIFQVQLHPKDTSPSIVDPSYSGPSPRMGDFVERIMRRLGGDPVGFDVAGSPFQFLRDSTHYHYRKQPSVGLGDVASGYIFLEPREKFIGCRWIDGFITPPMFATDRPFYEGRAGRQFSSAVEADAFFKTEVESMK